MPVTTKCYGQEETWKSRKEAMQFFLEGMIACEGAERDRYTDIYIQLLEGRTYCTDGWERR